MIKRLCLILFSIILLLMASCKEEQHYIRFFVGSYAPADSTGIYTCELNPETGAAKVIHSLSGIQNPSYLALHPDAPVLYAVAEAADKNTQSGAVWSLSLADDGSLEGMNQASSGGAHPCHLSVDQDGQLVLVANYSGGNLGLIPIREDHQTGQLVQVYQHLGSGPNPDRQTRAHAHSVNIHPKLAKAYACDLGTDEVLVYDIDFEKQMMQLDSTAIFKSSPGAGPRHFRRRGADCYSDYFHPAGWVYPGKSLR